MISDRILETFCGSIWNWYIDHKRVLPWRDMPPQRVSAKAYKVLVSEIMLQQTQVARVLYKWPEWLQSFPTIQSLASASNADVIRAWQGMGYNSRALRLRDIAIALSQYTDDNFPATYDAWIQFKGIGPYTAAAICNFALEVPTPCIDTNIRRIIHRTFYGPESAEGTWSVSDAALLATADSLLQCALNKKFVQECSPYWQSAPCAEWHAALMDFGSLVCTKTSPKWHLCPLTAAGINASAYNVPTLQKQKKLEPGRMVGAVFIPNRIFRGKVVEYLRTCATSQTIEAIGMHVCLDWSEELHPWLLELLLGLVKDNLLQKQGNGFLLS